MANNLISPSSFSDLHAAPINIHFFSLSPSVFPVTWNRIFIEIIITTRARVPRATVDEIFLENFPTMRQLLSRIHSALERPRQWWLIRERQSQSEKFMREILQHVIEFLIPRLSRSGRHLSRFKSEFRRRSTDVQRCARTHDSLSLSLRQRGQFFQI